MSTHLAEVSWALAGEDFRAGKYSREHVWKFDGGVTVPASPSPHVVREPYSNPANVDPEEAFVAAISSCHMLTFLSIAAKKRFVVDLYEDRAVGVMTKNDKGKLFVSKVTLDPTIEFSGEKRPTPEQIADMHHLAHQECFIANSVLTEIVVAGIPSH